MSEKHASGAVKAAENIQEWVRKLHNIKDWSRQIITKQFATFIDQETGLPEITAERDRLRESNAELRRTAQNLCDDFGSNLQTYDAHRYNLVEEIRAALAKEPESGEKDDEKP